MLKFSAISVASLFSVRGPLRIHYIMNSPDLLLHCCSDMYFACYWLFNPSFVLMLVLMLTVSD